MVHRTAVDVSLFREDLQGGEHVEGSIVPRPVLAQTHAFGHDDVVLSP